jgi:hypothetical protein
MILLIIFTTQIHHEAIVENLNFIRFSRRRKSCGGGGLGIFSFSLQESSSFKSILLNYITDQQRKLIKEIFGILCASPEYS